MDDRYSAAEAVDLTGLTPEEALAKMDRYGISSVRVMEQDGESLLGTCDYLADRLNVSVRDGRIVGTGSVG